MATIDFPVGWYTETEQGGFVWPGDDTTAKTLQMAYNTEIGMIVGCKIPQPCSAGNYWSWVRGDQNIPSLSDWPILHGDVINIWSDVAWSLEFPDPPFDWLWVGIVALGAGVAGIGVMFAIKKK